MLTITVDVKTLAAALIFTPKSDIRYYLVGVYVDFKAMNVVSTDGHRMFVTAKGSVAAEGDAVGAGIILPRGRVDAIVKGAKQFDEVAIEIDGQTFKCDPAGVTGLTVDGRFPNWRRAYPSSDALDGKRPFRVDADYYADTIKAARILAGSKKVYAIPEYTNETTLVSVVSEGAHVVTMAMRENKENFPATFTRFNV